MMSYSRCNSLHGCHLTRMCWQIWLPLIVLILLLIRLRLRLILVPSLLLPRSLRRLRLLLLLLLLLPSLLLPHLLLTCGPASPEVELACCACGLCVLQQGVDLAARTVADVERQAAAERVPPE